MSVQIHAPATEEEYAQFGNRTDDEIRAETSYWREESGWCSSCRLRERVVVHIGCPDRNVGICGECIAKLVATLGAGPEKGDAK